MKNAILAFVIFCISCNSGEKKAGTEKESASASGSAISVTKNGATELEDKGNNIAGMLTGPDLSLFLNGPKASLTIDLPDAAEGSFPVTGSKSLTPEKGKAHISLVPDLNSSFKHALNPQQGTLTIAQLNKKTCSGHFEATYTGVAGNYELKGDFKNVPLKKN